MTMLIRTRKYYYNRNKPQLEYIFINGLEYFNDLSVKNNVQNDQHNYVWNIIVKFKI